MGFFYDENNSGPDFINLFENNMVDRIRHEDYINKDDYLNETELDDLIKVLECNCAIALLNLDKMAKPLGSIIYPILDMGLPVLVIVDSSNNNSEEEINRIKGTSWADQFRVYKKVDIYGALDEEANKHSDNYFTSLAEIELNIETGRSNSRSEFRRESLELLIDLEKKYEVREIYDKGN